MLELGPLSEQEHRVVGRRAAQTVDLLVTYGDLARTIAAEAATAARQLPGRPAVVSFALDQRSELVDYMRIELQPGDVVLLKGSRTLRMEEFVEAPQDSPRAPTIV